MKSFILSGGLAVFAAFAAAPASAALGPIVAPCALTDISPNAVACSGFYGGNVLAGNATRRADQQAALDLIDYDGPAITSAFFGSLPSDATGDGVANFGVPMFGLTWIAIHFGNGADGPVSGNAGGGTAFYRLNLAAVTNSITVNWGAGSTGLLYKTSQAPNPPPPTPPIPEPGTWAMLIAGFGLVGGAARRRKVAVATA